MKGESPLRQSGLASRARGGVRERRNRYVAVGSIVTRARPAALLAALRELRPQCEVRFLRFGTREASHGASYHVEVRAAADLPPAGSIALWLRIKSALMAAFPEDKPNAVVAIDS